MAIISWEVDIFKKKEKTFSFRHIRLLAEKQQPNFLIATSNGALTKLITQSKRLETTVRYFWGENDKLIVISRFVLYLKWFGLHPLHPGSIFALYSSHRTDLDV